MASERNESVLEALRERYPWPEVHPDVKAYPWSLDGGGRKLVREKIRDGRMRVVLEIGSFLGGSIGDWLSVSPDVIVVAVDAWPETSEQFCLSDYARKNGKPQGLVDQLSRPDGFYETFLANARQHRERVIAVREKSPQILTVLANLGLRPDLIYLDCDKSGEEISICHDLFPGSIMAGDDWTWQDEQGRYPIRKPVEQFCQQHQLHLKVEKATWLIDTEPPSLTYRLRTWRRSLRSKLRKSAA